MMLGMRSAITSLVALGLAHRGAAVPLGPGRELRNAGCRPQDVPGSFPGEVAPTGQPGGACCNSGSQCASTVCDFASWSCEPVMCTPNEVPGARPGEVAPTGQPGGACCNSGSQCASTVCDYSVWMCEATTTTTATATSATATATSTTATATSTTVTATSTTATATSTTATSTTWTTSTTATTSTTTTDSPLWEPVEYEHEEHDDNGNLISTTTYLFRRYRDRVYRQDIRSCDTTNSVVDLRLMARRGGTIRTGALADDPSYVRGRTPGDPIEAMGHLIKLRREDNLPVASFQLAKGVEDTLYSHAASEGMIATPAMIGDRDDRCARSTLNEPRTGRVNPSDGRGFMLEADPPVFTAHVVPTHDLYALHGVVRRQPAEQPAEPPQPQGSDPRPTGPARARDSESHRLAEAASPAAVIMATISGVVQSLTDLYQSLTQFPVSEYSPGPRKQYFPVSEYSPGPRKQYFPVSEYSPGPRKQDPGV